MSEFALAVEYVLAREGGLQDDANDKGGITNMGISLRFLKSLSADSLRQYGFVANPETINRVDIEQLTPAQAKSLYKGEFWDHVPFQSINNQANCNFLFDMAVNMGIAPAIKCAQRACWAVMKQKEIIKDDGVMGNLTISMINQCCFYLLPAMRSERAAHYRLILEQSPSQKEFFDGWLNRAYGIKGV